LLASGTLKPHDPHNLAHGIEIGVRFFALIQVECSAFFIKMPTIWNTVSFLPGDHRNPMRDRVRKPAVHHETVRSPYDTDVGAKPHGGAGPNALSQEKP
jgi:hypothetical protein